MAYRIKEMHYTLQGEGANVGRPAVFVRFSNCNLWSGYEKDRATALCRFCDTDFVGVDGENGGVYKLGDLSQKILKLAQISRTAMPLVVLTGGEPMLQVDPPLVQELLDWGFDIAMETNGTIEVPHWYIDNGWLTVSPKAGTKIHQMSGEELKLVFPQSGLLPDDIEQDWHTWRNFDHYVLQPMDGPDIEANTINAIKYCKANPRWRLSLQVHKLLGIA